jgi:hypothetical protein
MRDLKRPLRILGRTLWATMLAGLVALPVIQGNLWIILLPISVVAAWMFWILVRRTLAKTPRPRHYYGTEEEAVGKLLREGKNYLTMNGLGRAQLVENEQGDDGRWFVTLNCAVYLDGRTQRVLFDHVLTVVEPRMREVTDPTEKAEVLRRIEAARNGSSL